MRDEKKSRESRASFEIKTSICKEILYIDGEPHFAHNQNLLKVEHPFP